MDRAGRSHMGIRRKYEKVVVLAPSNLMTGGPELLHQLVHEIRTLGGNACVCYWPDPSAPVPEGYRHYDVAKTEKLPSSPGCCIVAPETMYGAIPLRSASTRFLWWLSYDFFKSRRRDLLGRAAANAYKFGRVYLMTLLGVQHLFQSYYAQAKLKEKRITGQILTDYLSVETDSATQNGRDNIILYNPKKGIEITKTLIDAFPDYKFTPIINMNRSQVEAILRRAKMYIDFGEHPGKDRLPREAASLGAVVVVGLRGSARHEHDVPLPQAYKLETGDALIGTFGRLTDDIFASFDKHFARQKDYRTFILGERRKFTEQVEQIFFVDSGAVPRSAQVL